MGRGEGGGRNIITAKRKLKFLKDSVMGGIKEGCWTDQDIF